MDEILQHIGKLAKLIKDQSDVLKSTVVKQTQLCEQVSELSKIVEAQQKEIEKLNQMIAAMPPPSFPRGGMSIFR